jgi:uncharacterized protein
MRSGDPLQRKHDLLVARLQSFPSLGVAFSGGVDSSLLLAVAAKVLTDRVVAMTARSATHPRYETDLAVELAQKLGARHIVFDSDEMEDPDFIANSPQRCYYCKRRLFAAMRSIAADLGIENLAHGANLDDQQDFRPGFKAADELAVSAPLVEAGLNKEDIRRLAQRLGLTNWDRPAMACLASRVPYGTTLDPKILRQIEAAEAVLMGMGLSQCRVRHHGRLARIEIPLSEMAYLNIPDRRREIVKRFKSLGFDFACLDLEGYISGKMNRGIH